MIDLKKLRRPRQIRIQSSIHDRHRDLAKRSTFQLPQAFVINPETARRLQPGLLRCANKKQLPTSLIVSHFSAATPNPHPEPVEGRSSSHDSRRQHGSSTAASVTSPVGCTTGRASWSVLRQAQDEVPRKHRSGSGRFIPHGRPLGRS